MASGITAAVAEWASACRYEDLPPSVRERARQQTVSVLAAVFAGARTGVGGAVGRASRRWGRGADASILPEGERASVHGACYVNAVRSVALDFDEYLFAGHTGHSAVLGALALGEATGASGRAVLAAQVVGNEVAGRLGAAFLLGPHNGQMWTYIHALAGACVAGRFLELDAERLGHAIGLALAQPPYPLAPAFFGPDSKALMAAEPLVAGIRAAELAAEGLTGADDIIGGAEGMLARIGTRPFRFPFTALGEAWVTDSLTFKLYPGCAYVDTAVDAFEQIRAEFAARHGRSLAASDVGGVRVEATVFTCGMEAMAAPHRLADRLRAVDVNFSVALSLGALVAAGRIDAETLRTDSLATHRAEILAVVDRVQLELDPALTAQTGGLAEAGIDLAKYLAEGGEPETLTGADFRAYEMRFPARVTLTTPGGEEYAAEVAIPRGGAGRAWEETVAAVRDKFLANAGHLGERAAAAYDLIVAIDSADDVRRIVDGATGR